MRTHESVCSAPVVFLVAMVMAGCAPYQVTEVPKDESHVYITAEDKASLLPVLRRHTTRGLYIAPVISPSKLSNARRMCVTTSEEQVLALIDATVFGSAKHCLLVGTSGIYMRNDWAAKSPGRHFIPYVDFVDASIGKNGLYNVSIGGINFNTPGCSMSKDAVINLLRDTQRIIERRQPPPPPPSPPSPPPPPSPQPKEGQRFAVVIGISNYADTRIPPLRYAGNDAQAFYNWITSPEGGKYSPSRVRLLLDKDATGPNIKNLLYDWLRQPLEEDMVIIYFAGHGSPESPDAPQNLFLLPYDADYAAITSTGFPMWDIETALKRFIKAKKVVVIVDACHSGGVGESFDIVRRSNRGIKVNAISSSLQNLSKVANGVAIFSASADNQYSQESKNWGGGHGVFTHFLLKGLKGAADFNSDRVVNLGELNLYLSEQVRRATKSAQSPILSGKFDPALTIGK